MTLYILFALLSLSFAASATDETVKYIYVWVGSPAADYVYTVDYDPESPTFGDTLHKAPVDITKGNVLVGGNEAHHMAISADNKYLIVGNRAPGVQGKDEVFVYEIDEVTKFPIFSYSLDPPGGSCADELTATNTAKTRFIVTHLCNTAGQNPGALSWIDIVTRQTGVWVSSAESDDKFNPHGGDYYSGVGYIAASFINVVPPAAGSGLPREYRDQLHVFDVNGDLDVVIDMPTAGVSYLPNTVGAGYMDVRWIDATHAVTCASLEGKIYLLTPFANTKYREALDIAAEVNGGVNTFSGTTIRVNKAKNRVIATYGLRYVLLFSIDSNYNFDLLDVIDMCSQTGLSGLCADKDNLGPYGGVHYVRLNEDETRVVISSYYQSYPSIKRVHSFTIAANFNSLTLETSFNPEMDGANPHGVVYAEWLPPEPAPEPAAAVVFGVPSTFLFAILGLLAALVH